MLALSIYFLLCSGSLFLVILLPLVSSLLLSRLLFSLCLVLFLRVLLTVIAHVIVPDTAIALGHVIGLVILHLFISLFFL